MPPKSVKTEDPLAEFFAFKSHNGAGPCRVKTVLDALDAPRSKKLRLAVESNLSPWRLMRWIESQPENQGDEKQFMLTGTAISNHRHKKCACYV